MSPFKKKKTFKHFPLKLWVAEGEMQELTDLAVGRANLTGCL